MLALAAASALAAAGTVQADADHTTEQPARDIAGPRGAQ